MGTEVLRPQDVLIERMRLSNPSVLPHRKSYYTGNCNTNRSSHRKQFIRSSEPRKRVFHTDSSILKKNDVVLGPVTILKRGESIEFKTKNEILVKKPSGDLVVRVKDPSKLLKPEEVYAGSAIFSSPSPRKLPLPSFSKKKSFDDSATKDLRRLLRLD